MKNLKKISLANIEGKLSRKEMKNIMAGSGSGKKCGSCTSAYDCASNCNSCRAGACEAYA